MRLKTTRGEGLVPRLGGGEARQDAPCQFAVRIHNFGPSYLGVPAPAGSRDISRSCALSSWRSSTDDNGLESWEPSLNTKPR